MRAYARYQGAQVSVSKIKSDMMENEGDSMNEKTIDSYLEILRKLFVIEDMPAWNPNLRSKSAIRTADTRYFIDPSIAVAALGAGPQDLIYDLETFGLLFETMAVRDLRIYADAMNGNVFHYRDKDGLECDAVIHLRNGHYGLVEIKLGGDSNIEAGAATLISLKDKIDTTRMPSPSFLMVLTGLSSYAYMRPDGVWVVPIAPLKP
jgi:predicted AAA+ superfamily ATPase